MRLLLAILALSLAIPSFARAQSAGSIEVLVRDEATGRPLAGAMVVVEDGPIARTDELGHTILLDLVPGRYRVAITVQGYERDERELEVVAAATTQLAVGLSAQVVEVEGVEVVGESRLPHLDRSGFYDRQKLYPGTFIQPEEIAAARARGTPMSSVLRGQRGLSLQANPNGRGFTAVAGRTIGLSLSPCPLSIFVDGVRRYRETEIDRVLPMMDVEAIEIHTGVQVPLQYAAGCGSIVIWTRKQK